MSWWNKKKETTMNSNEQAAQQQETKLNAFLSVCRRRDGKPFDVTEYQRNPANMITAIKGTLQVVDQKGHLTDIDMLWSIDGRAMCNPPNIGYDLINATPITLTKVSSN